MAPKKEIYMVNGTSISIIVPVYKAEAYLHRCVESILAQTFTDWELLLIDDGSPDRSGDICDEYAKKDIRIRVIHKENGGVSSARQRGQDEACGEYTIHVDPDDWVELTMLEELYQKAKDDNSDMVICDYYTNQGSQQNYVKQEPTKPDNNVVLYELFQQLHGSCCNKLVRRACYSGKANFPKGINCCEDLIWCIQVLKCKPTISYINKAYYHYMITTTDSQSKSISAERSLQDLKMLQELEALLSFDKKMLKIMYMYTVPYVMKRAMKTCCFDSDYFKCNFKKYSRYIISSHKSSFMLRITCYISAIGGYRLCLPLIKMMK